MNSYNKTWIAIALVAVLALVGVFLPSAQGPDLITTVPGTRSATNLGNLELTGTLDVAGAATVGGGFGASGCTFTDTGAISCNGAAAFANTLALTGAATFAGEAKFTAPTQVTVTANSTIATAGYTVVPLYAAGTVGTANVTGCQTAGKLTVLRNISNQSITITDTSTIMLSANAVLTQYDTLTLLGDGTNCLQLAIANN